jgi:protein-S-isoprenylcysteine O-methyltransferase Ste14
MVSLIASHAASVLAGLSVLAIDTPWLAAAYFLVCRLAYVVYVGVSLKREESREDRAGADARYERFKSRANFLMNNDAVAFVALCLVTRFMIPLPMELLIPAGVVLMAAGLGCKFWAAKTLGLSSYFWKDFFVPPDRFESCREGPYRLLRNPMYTVGYAHAYGSALATASLVGLIAAAFDHATILALYWAVEKPHVKRQTELAVLP